MFRLDGDITPADGCHCAQWRKWSGHYFARADILREALSNAREHWFKLTTL